jgi:endonuclease YncB( thermonuclease family)
MKLQFLTIFLTFFYSLSGLADNSQTIRPIEVLKGDTFIGIDYKGASKFYHIAGVDCADPQTQDGRDAINFLRQAILNKTVYVTTTVDLGTHALAWVSPSLGGGGLDIGANILQNGKCWYRNSDSDNLRSTQKASYGLLQDRARYKKIGIWKNGMYFSTANPDSWRDLQVYKYNQQYVNGATNPAHEDFGRPSPTATTAPSPPPVLNRNGIVDWRKPITHNVR